MSRPRICLCGWCRTVLPDTGDWIVDAVEVQHHFLVAHGQPTNHSVRYVYVDQVVESFVRVATSAGSER